MNSSIQHISSSISPSFKPRARTLRVGILSLLQTVPHSAIISTSVPLSNHVPSEINFYGLVENPIEVLANDVEIVAGSQYAKDDSYVEKTTSKLKLSGSMSVVTPPTTINTTLSNGNILSDVKVSKLDTTGAYPTIEVFGLNYKDVDSISSVTIESTVYTVTEVLEKPIFKQYSGKVSQTKKLTNTLKLGNTETNSENTKLFREIS